MATDASVPWAEYKDATREQWNRSGGGYHAWSETLAAITRPAVQRLMDLAGIGPGGRVLELAAGGGVLTLQLARRVGRDGLVLATDLAPEILALAQASADAQGLTQVQTREMDGEALGAAEGTFDAVVSSLGLMFFPEPEASVRQQLAKVNEGGAVGAVVMSAPDHNPFLSIPVGIIRERAGLPLPKPGAPGLFALGAPGAVGAVFERAGARDVRTEAVAGTLELASVEEHLRFLREAVAALHQMMGKMSDAAKEDAWTAVAEALAPLEGEAGFRSPVELLVCVGCR